MKEMTIKVSPISLGSFPLNTDGVQDDLEDNKASSSVKSAKSKWPSKSFRSSTAKELRRKPPSKVCISMRSIRVICWGTLKLIGVSIGASHVVEITSNSFGVTSSEDVILDVDLLEECRGFVNFRNSRGKLQRFFCFLGSLTCPAAVPLIDGWKILLPLGPSVADGGPCCGTVSVSAFEVIVSLRHNDADCVTLESTGPANPRSGTVFSNDDCLPMLSPLLLAVGESPRTSLWVGPRRGSSR